MRVSASSKGVTGARRAVLSAQCAAFTRVDKYLFVYAVLVFQLLLSKSAAFEDIRNFCLVARQCILAVRYGSELRHVAKMPLKVFPFRYRYALSLSHLFLRCSHLFFFFLTPFTTHTLCIALLPASSAFWHIVSVLAGVCVCVSASLATALFVLRNSQETTNLCAFPSASFFFQS